MRLSALRTADSGREPVEYVGYLTRVIGLRDKLADLWQQLQLAPAEPRCDDDFNRRPSTPYGLIPSIDPGMLMSVNTLISSRLS